jgi:putative endonuclease
VHDPSGLASLAPQDDETELLVGARLMGGWTYMLKCADDSFYVGSTSHDDVERRVAEHNDALYVGYTAMRRPVVLVWSRRFDDLREAHETERRLKGWSRAKKLALIANDEATLVSLSVRRTGKPTSVSAPMTKRQLSVLAQEAGAKTAPTKPLATPRKSTTMARSGGPDMPMVKLATSRHPEVRARAQRGGAPKDD